MSGKHCHSKLANALEPSRLDHLMLVESFVFTMLCFTKQAACKDLQVRENAGGTVA